MLKPKTGSITDSEQSINREYRPSDPDAPTSDLKAFLFPSPHLVPHPLFPLGDYVYFRFLSLSLAALCLNILSLLGCSHPSSRAVEVVRNGESGVLLTLCCEEARMACWISGIWEL